MPFGQGGGVCYDVPSKPTDGGPWADATASPAPTDRRPWAWMDVMGLLERKPLRRALWNWRLRHQHRANFGLHLIGIPLAVTGAVLFFLWPWQDWYWGVGAFVVGYLLQWIGHHFEGNDLGEWAGIKRLLGLPYVSIAPQYQNRAAD